MAWLAVKWSYHQGINEIKLIIQQKSFQRCLVFSAYRDCGQRFYFDGHCEFFTRRLAGLQHNNL